MTMMVHNWGLIDLDAGPQSLSQRPYLIKHVLDHGDLGALYGPSGAGKSFLALHMAGAIAMGEPWFGHRTKASGVAYVVAEGAAGFAKRWIGFKGRMGLAHCDNLIAADAAPSLGGHDSQVEELIEFLRAASQHMTEPLRLVIIDTLAQTMSGQDENVSAAMTGLISAAQRMKRELDVAVLFVHHTGKDTERGLRGHSSLKAAMDTVISVTSTEESRASIWTLEKRKDDADGSRAGFKLEVLEIARDEDGDPVNTCVVVELEQVPNHNHGSRRDGYSRYNAPFNQTICEFRDEGYSKIDIGSLTERFTNLVRLEQPDATQDAIKKGLSGRIERAIGAGWITRDGDWLTLLDDPPG